MAENEESEKTYPREGVGATWGSPAEAVSEMIANLKARLRNDRSDSE